LTNLGLKKPRPAKQGRSLRKTQTRGEEHTGEGKRVKARTEKWGRGRHGPDGREKKHLNRSGEEKGGVTRFGVKWNKAGGGASVYLGRKIGK